MECLIIRVRNIYNVPESVFEEASSKAVAEMKEDFASGKWKTTEEALTAGKLSTEQVINELDARVRLKLATAMALTKAAHVLGAGKTVAVFDVHPFTEAEYDMMLEFTIGVDPKTVEGVPTDLILNARKAAGCKT